MIKINEEQAQLLQAFFGREDIQKLLDENNFKDIFYKYRWYAREVNAHRITGIAIRHLVKLIDDDNVDWIHNTDNLPDYLYRFSDKTELHIPLNIKEIGDLIILGSKITDIYYEGTIDEFRRLHKADSAFYNDELNTPMHQPNIHCSDGDYKERFTL